MVYAEALRPVLGALGPPLSPQFCMKDLRLCFILVSSPPPPFLAFLVVFVLVFSG